MLVYKILQAFLLPSVFLLGFLITGLILIWKRKKKLGLILLLVTVLAYYAFSITPVSNVLLEPLENSNYVEKEQMRNVDTVVVLLGGKPESQIRAGEALRIYNLKEKKPRIIISGRSPIKDFNLAEQVKNRLVQRGVEEKDIVVEDESKTTFQNAEQVKGIIEEEPFFLVTSAYHMPRALLSFRHFKTNPIPAPSHFRMQEVLTGLDYLPDAYNLNSANKAFHEYFGIIYYRLIHL